MYVHTCKLTNYRGSNGVEKIDHTKLYFKNGIKVGNNFWLMGAEYKKDGIFDSTDSESNLMQSSTMLWLAKRGLWRRGPDLQPHLSWCAIF